MRLVATYVPLVLSSLLANYNKFQNFDSTMMQGTQTEKINKKGIQVIHILRIMIIRTVHTKKFALNNLNSRE